MSACDERLRDRASEVAGAARQQDTHSGPPVLEQILDGAIEIDLRLPAESLVDPGRVAEEQRRVVRTVAGRVYANGDRDARPGDEAIEQLANGNRDARADVEHVAGLSVLDDQAVRAHCVPHVREVAPRVQVADRDFRRPLAPLDVCDAPREAGRSEKRVLPRSEVIECAGHQTVTPRPA